jgi:hypothetical protein
LSIFPANVLDPAGEPDYPAVDSGLFQVLIREFGNFIIRLDCYEYSSGLRPLARQIVE